MIPPASSKPPADGISPGALLGRIASSIAIAILLSCAAARAFAPELAFRVSEVRVVRGAPGQAPALQSTGPNAGDPARLVFAAALVAAWGFWLTGQALTGELRLRRPGLASLIALFAILSLLSVLVASDRRAAWSCWVEQAALLGACLLAAQVFGERGMLRLATTVLGAVAIALAIKGYWQVLVEFPANAEYLKEHGLEAIRDTGHDPIAPAAGMLRKRILSTTPYGYFHLANPFASLLLVGCLAAAALAIAKLKAAGAERRLVKGPRGEVHLPTLAGGLAGVGAIATLVILLLTRTRGAIAATVLAGAGALVAWRFREYLARRWRRCIVVAGALAMLGVAGIVAWGVAHDSLPTRTMTFRWYYWTASSRVVLENPLLGVGPGNFASSYLQHRRVEGEEQIKAPHNVVVHALTQYGFAGGLCYLAILAWVLAASTRPGEAMIRDLPPPSHSTTPRNIAIAVVASVLATRLAFTGSDSSALILLDAIAPAATMALCLALLLWDGGLSVATDRYDGLLRLALGAAVAGFVLHNLVTFSLWMPGPATLFWVAAGVCLAGGPGARAIVSKTMRWPVAIASIVTLGLVIVALGGPVFARYSASKALAKRIEAGDLPGAARLARTLAAADPLDPRAAEDAAKVLAHAASIASSPPRRREFAEQAVEMAREAIDRDPASFGPHRLAGDIRWHTAERGSPQRREALDHMAQAVERDPMDARLRVDYARMLLLEGRREACREQLTEALRIDASLPRRGRPEGSPMQLTPAELAEVARLRGESDGR
jgi:tetratricopeptide (TPR) repeat protein